MSKTVAELYFSAAELEGLCGLEVTSHWIGSPWAGAYRLGYLNRHLLLKTILLEGLLLGLSAIATLPLSLGAMLRLDGSAAVFGLVLAASTLTLLLLRQGLLRRNRGRWRSLLNLLEAVDRFHESLAAVELLRSLDHLNSAPPSSLSPQLPPATLSSLLLTRDSLVTGLMTERLLRSHQPALSRCHELLYHLEDNWAELQRLDAARQVKGEELQEAMEISSSVRRELKLLVGES